VVSFLTVDIIDIGHLPNHNTSVNISLALLNLAISSTTDLKGLDHLADWFSETALSLLFLSPSYKVKIQVATV
jgi:hypothetical protein